MKILLTSFTFPPAQNGVSNVVYHQAKGLQLIGHEVIVATNGINRQSNVNEVDGVKRLEFNVSGNANIRTRYSGEIKRYVDFIGKFECDLICCHCWQIWSTDLAVRSFKLTSAKKVLVSHGVSANSRRPGIRSFLNWLLWKPYLLITMPKMLVAFDHIIFLCELEDNDRFYDRRLLNEIGRPSFSVVPNGVDLRRFDQSSEKLFRDTYNLGNKLVVLCVGNYSFSKNEMMALKAFALSKISNAVFVSVGEKYNNYARSLENLWKSIKTPNCEFLCLHGIDSNTLNSAFKSADLLVSASKTEYFPLIILEAMASRTAYISTDVGCVKKLPGGVVVSNVIEMAESIRRLANDSKMRYELSTQGRYACEKYYSWDKVVEQYNDIFTTITR